MKLTYEKINGSLPALEKLSKLDIKAAEAVKLARLIGKVEDELKPLAKAQKNLLIKYGEEVENGSYKIKPENHETFSKEYRELLETEVDIGSDIIEIKSDIVIDTSSVLALGEMVTFGGE